MVTGSLKRLVKTTISIKTNFHFLNHKETHSFLETKKTKRRTPAPLLIRQWEKEWIPKFQDSQTQGQCVGAEKAQKTLRGTKRTNTEPIKR